MLPEYKGWFLQVHKMWTCNFYVNYMRISVIKNRSRNKAKVGGQFLEKCYNLVIGNTGIAWLA